MTPGKPTVLVVDDEPDNLELLQRSLRRQYELLGAASGEEAMEIIRSNRDIACVITDQRMPGLSGVEVLRESIALIPEAVRIIVTGYTDVRDILDAINVGHVNRFVLKPIEPDRFVNTVKEALEVYFLIRERNFLQSELLAKTKHLEEHEKELTRLVADRTVALTDANARMTEANRKLEELNSRLQDLALRDGLTGLYNHRYFQERIVAEVARSRRHGHETGLLFIDIDKFKDYNDAYGHPAGDELLKTLAKIFLEGTRMVDVVARVRGSDVVARYGGEEFAIILPETGLDGSLSKAERIRTAVAAYPFPGRETQPGGAVTVSVGSASFPGCAVDAPALIRSADRALYAAKREGRNRVCRAEARESP